MQPKLRDVTFQKGVVWSFDARNGWDAAAYNSAGAKELILSTQELSSGAESVSPRKIERKGMYFLPTPSIVPFTHSLVLEPSNTQSSFPPELLIQIISEVGLSRRDPDAFHRQGSPKEQETLKALCLVDHRLRVLSQPILFDHVKISGTADACLSRIRGLLELFAVREESATWIKALSLKWMNLHLLQSPADRALREELLADSTKLFLHLQYLRTFRAVGIRLSSDMIAHLYRLTTLRTLKLLKITVPPDPLAYADFDTHDNLVEDVYIDWLFQGAPLSPTLLPLLQSHRLRELRIGYVYPNEVLHGLARQTFASVTRLSVDNGTSPIAAVITLALLCPTLTAIHLGMGSGPNHALITSPVPTYLPPSA